VQAEQSIQYSVCDLTRGSRTSSFILAPGHHDDLKSYILIWDMSTGIRGLSDVDKSRHDSEHRRLTSFLRDLRDESGLRQIDLAERLGVHQSFVSKYEGGERRLDLIELQAVCDALGQDLVKVVRRFISGR
jgi:DNA-binding XRE family transcriptional regulator